MDDFATISRHGEENGSCDHIITRKDPKQLAQVNFHIFKIENKIKDTYSCF